MGDGRVFRPSHRVRPRRELRWGGIEIIGYDAESETYRTHFFDSQGNAITEELTIQGDTWTWQGEKTRCTGVFSDHGKMLTAHHERSADGVNWVPAMDVTLTKVV
jgi:hypothetical protein